jgi:hypothetical protein
MDNKVPRPTKRQRPASILRHVSTSPLPHNEDWNSGQEILIMAIASSLETKMSIPSGGYFPTVAGLRYTAATDDRVVSHHQFRRKTRTSGLLASLRTADPPALLELPRHLNPLLQRNPPLPTGARRRPELEARQIIGKEDVDGVLYYMMDWHPILLPERLLGHIKELVDKFKAGRAGAKADTLTGQEEEKLQGRPRNLVEVDN